MIADRGVALYRENGYVVVQGVLEPALVESLRQEVSEILDKARGHRLVGIVQKLV
jgi:hypothetical protein